MPLSKRNLKEPKEEWRKRNTKSQTSQLHKKKVRMNPNKLHKLHRKKNLKRNLNRKDGHKVNQEGHPECNEETLAPLETMPLQPVIKRKLALKLKLFKQLKHKLIRNHHVMRRHKHVPMVLHMHKLYLSLLNMEMHSVITKLKLDNNLMLLLRLKLVALHKPCIMLKISACAMNKHYSLPKLSVRHTLLPWNMLKLNCRRRAEFRQLVKEWQGSRIVKVDLWVVRKWQERCRIQVNLTVL